jgi:hypothetical protein
MRGINRQEIFHEAEDYQRYIDTLQRIVLESEADLLGYCLMDSLQHMDKTDRNKTIRKMKEIEGISLRQIARIIGLNLKMVYKA